MFDQNKKNIEEKKVEETPEVKFNQIKQIKNPLKKMYVEKAKAGMIEKTL